MRAALRTMLDCALALRKPAADNENGRMVRQDYSCPGSCLPQPRQGPVLLLIQSGHSIRRFRHPPRCLTTAGQRRPSRIDWETHCSRRLRRTRRGQERQHRGQGSSWLIPLVRAAVGRNCGPVIRHASLDRETLGGALPVGHQRHQYTLLDALVKYLQALFFSFLARPGGMACEACRPLPPRSPPAASACRIPLRVRLPVCYPGHTKAAAPGDCP